MPHTSTSQGETQPIPKNPAPGNAYKSSAGTNRSTNPSRSSDSSPVTSGNGSERPRKFHLPKSKNVGTAVPARKNTTSSDNSQLEIFFHDQLKDIYWAEKHLTRVLPKMEKAATTRDLKGAIQANTRQTHARVARLERVFQLIGSKARAKKCEAMAGVIKESESAVEETPRGSMTRDVAIIMSAQKAEHYKIASYGTLVQLAETMSNNEVAQILNATLNEEKDTDQHLSALAEDNIDWEPESAEENPQPIEQKKKKARGRSYSVNQENRSR